MPHNRFFAKEPILHEGLYELCPEENSHLKVLRPHIGDHLELIDGKGTLGKGTVHSLEKNRAFVLIQAIYKELPSLFQKKIALALLRPSHLDFAIEKMTELGTDAIFLFPGILSEKKELSAHALQRLFHIARAACKQSGRLFMPQITFFPTLKTILQDITNTHIYFGDLEGSRCKCIPNENSLFFIGPESGLCEEEKKLLKSHLATPILLSKNILRAETAAMVATHFLVSY